MVWHRRRAHAKHECVEAQVLHYLGQYGLKRFAHFHYLQQWLERFGHAGRTVQKDFADLDVRDHTQAPAIYYSESPCKDWALTMVAAATRISSHPGKGQAAISPCAIPLATASCRVEAPSLVLMLSK